MDDPTGAATSTRRGRRADRAGSAGRYADLFEHALLGICITEPAGAVVACNPAFAQLLGFASVAEALGTNMAALYATSSDRRELLEELQRRKRIEAYRTRLRRRDGRVIEVMTSVVGQFDEGGALIEIRGYILDMTASIEAETALADRERLFRAVFYGASDAMLILDDRRIVCEVNPAAATLFGRTIEQLVGESLDHLIIDGPETLPSEWHEFMALGEIRREHDVLASSEVRTLECSFRARVQDERHLCIARDITDRRLLEDRLAQAARIESVGRLAGGIAHDFNNLLTAILGYTELLLASRSAGDPEREDLEQIQQAGHRASALTQQLLAFGRKQVLKSQQVDLNRTVTALLPMLKRVLREDIVLRTDLAPSPALVMVDQHQIEQAILNLVLNARDALPVGGSVQVAIAHVTLSSEQLPAEHAGHAGPYVRLRVTDDGTGIPPETRAHVFEPFFTTKEFGKGTGLGLASVHGIVHQSGGFITVDCPQPGGSVFALHFPAVVPVRAEPGDLHGARETILLVEDEDSVRVIVGAVLRRQGYHVLEAATPQVACDIFEQHIPSIALLLTDIVMPGMNGPALAQRCVGRKPGLCVLFISGYVDWSVTPGLSGAHVGFLAKPFQAAALTGAVRDLLNRTQAHSLV